MNSILSNPPKYFRAPVSRGGDPRVDRNGGYRGAGIIHGVSVITKGVALGHDVWIDEFALSQVADAINGQRIGIKSRFTHPSMSGDGLGKHVARVMDAEVSGDQVIADQHFLASAHKAPDGDLAEYLMSLADEDPESYGLSIAFQHDEAAMEQFLSAHTVDGEFRSPDPANIHSLLHVRIAELHAADSVDDPAANPGGLFSRAGDIAREAEAFVSYALGRTNERPESHFGLDPDRARGFMARYFDTHSLSFKESEMAEQPVEPSTEPEPTNLAIEPGSRVQVKAGMEHDESHVGMIGTVGEVSTPAYGIRWDSTPDVLHKWYTEAELELTNGEAPAEPTPEATVETEASSRDEAKQFVEVFGANGGVWFAEGLSFEQCRDRQVEQLRKEIESLQSKLAARPLDGEESPVSFDSGERKRNGFASKIKVK